MVERGAKLVVAGTQKERHEGENLRARRKAKFGSREKGKGKGRERWRNASGGNRGLVEPKEKKSRWRRRRRRITPARLHARKGYMQRGDMQRREEAAWKNIRVEVDIRWRKGNVARWDKRRLEEARVCRASARDGRKRGKKWESRRAASPGGWIPAPRRELRGSGARECIIKKQETSSFSPPLVKILNGDFMLPALLTRASFLLPRLFAAPIPMGRYIGNERLCAWIARMGCLVARNGDSIYKKTNRGEGKTSFSGGIGEFIDSIFMRILFFFLLLLSILIIDLRHSFTYTQMHFIHRNSRRTNS